MSTQEEKHPGDGLEVFFKAKSIVIVGASNETSKIGGRPIHFLLKYGYQGKIYPVNPRGGVVQGIQAYSSIADIPEKPEMAILAVPAVATPQALQECADHGVKGVIVLSAGFSEAGPEGEKLQHEIVAIAQKYGIRLLGPNCLGAIGVADSVIGSFSIILEQSMPTLGNVGVVSQSGNIGSFVVQNIARRGLGVSRFIATGNEADIDVADGIAALVNDPQTRIVICCMETCRNAEKLIYALNLARKNNKPVIALKIGSTEQGQSAAASHTGALAGSDAVIDAVFKRYGVLRVHSIEALLEIAHAGSILLPNRLPKGSNVTVVAASGGFGIMMADATAKAGLALNTLSPETKTRVLEAIPLAGTNNPVDASAQMSARPDILFKMLAALMEEPNADVIQLFLSLSLYNERLRDIYLEALAQIRSMYPDKILVVTSQGPADVVRQINELGIPVFSSIDATAIGLKGLIELSKLADLGEALAYEGERKPLALEAFRNEYNAKKSLRAVGINALDEAVVTSAEEAISHSARMGFPVVMKIVSEDIQHKTEVGGVVLNISNETDAKQAFEQIISSVKTKVPDARLDGVLVTPMAKGGAELIMGVSRDPVFGPVVMVGIGGIYAEVLQDIALQVAPVSELEAHSMIRSLKMFPILNGARGQKKADIKAAAQTLAKLSEFACCHEENVAEIDMNPVLVKAEGEGVVVLDALFIPTNHAELSK